MRNFWTLEKCLEVAKLCETRLQFMHLPNGAYGKMCKKGWFNHALSVKNGLV